jgi:uncharacterized protein (TIGR02266 family)
MDVRKNTVPPAGPIARERGGLGSFIVDRRGTILGLDRGVEELTGWPAVEIVGRNKDLSRALDPGETGDLRIVTVPFYEGSIPVPLRTVSFELRLRCRDGHVVDSEAVAHRLPGPGERVAVTLLRILARSEGPPAPAGDRRDPLTSLADRDAFSGRLGADLRAGRITGRPVALILADVDHLRRINDRLGHPAGDVTLRKLAGILRASVREHDLVARLGEDDFAVLLPGAGRGEARQTAARIRSTVERFEFFRPVEGESPATVTLSLGAASFPADADDEAELLQRAHDALDEARVMGRNRVWCYTRRPRVPIRVPVYFDGVDPLLVGYTQDLSPSGIFIQTPSPMDIGMRCALAFPLPGRDGKVHVIGRVVRSVPTDRHETRRARMPGMGVEFERFGPEDRRAIERFLHAKESSTLRPENGTLSL